MKQALLASLLFMFAVLSRAEPPPTTLDTGQLDATNQYLVAAVASSKLVFVRNGNRYTGEQAAAHIQRKYEYFRKKITTPEEFISLCASRSLLTGQAYEVILADGNTIHLEDWLQKVLQRYREQN